MSASIQNAGDETMKVCWGRQAMSCTIESERLLSPSDRVEKRVKRDGGTLIPKLCCAGDCRKHSLERSSVPHPVFPVAWHDRLCSQHANGTPAGLDGRGGALGRLGGGQGCLSVSRPRQDTGLPVQCGSGHPLLPHYHQGPPRPPSSPLAMLIKP
jgi:hypothetical protein